MPLNRDLALRCLKTSEQLRDLAKAGDWQRFEQRLAERNRLLEPLLTEDYSEAETNSVRTLVDKIKVLDKEAMDLAEENKAKVIAEIKQGNKGRKMKAAYGATRRPY